jgi:protein SCO1
VNASYRLGLAVVAGTLAVSTIVCVALASPWPDPGPQAEALEHPVGKFALVERSGRTVTDADLADGVWIAAFVFSRCPSSCPRISKVMKDVQGDLAATGVRLVSISVDPDYDKPAILREFASRYGADAERWLFLTGDKAEIFRLILGGFIQSVSDVPPAERKGDIEAVSHSASLSLVGPGNVLLGVYSSSDPDSVRRLEARARSLDRTAKAARTGWVLRLPALNASLNASCAVLLLIGWGLIRRGMIRSHAACMIAAIAVSGVFLSSYLVYHYHMGSVPFRGLGPIRIAYLSILLSHTVLAVAVVPLILVTLSLAVLGRFKSHARLARVTFPVWMYVSVTGVVVYLMLYQIPISPSSAG